MSRATRTAKNRMIRPHKGAGLRSLGFSGAACFAARRHRRRGGTRVKVRGTAKKGCLEVHYFSTEEFERLCDILFPAR